MPVTSHPHLVLAVTLARPGGTTNFVFEYAKWLKHKGFQVTLLAGEGEWLYEQAKQAEIPCLRVPWMQREINPWRDLLAVFSLARLLRQLKPDVIQLNSSKMGVIGSFSARLARVPRVVYFIGGWAFLEALAPWKKRFYVVAERLTAPLKDVIICLHPGDKHIAEAKRIRPKQGLQIVPNGVDIAFLDRTRLSRIDARQTLGIPQDGFVFGTIANFYPAKHLPTYIRFIAPVLKQNPATSVVLIGDGPERALIEQAIKETATSDQIVLTGSQEQAHRLLAAFDIFVLPSTKEGMPFSLLEAMAARLPCIATTVGAHEWMLQGTGSFLVPTDDQAALQTAFQGVLQQRARLSDLGEANRTAVERRFPLERTFEAHLAICLDQK